MAGNKSVIEVRFVVEWLRALYELALMSFILRFSEFMITLQQDM